MDKSKQYPHTEWRVRVFAEIAESLESLQWSAAEIRAYMVSTYHGRTSRSQLADNELRQLSRYLDWAADNIKSKSKSQS